MTIQYTVYDNASGAILRTGSTMTLAQAQLQGSKAGTSVATVGTDPTNQAIDPTTGNPRLRVPMNVGGTNTVANKTTLAADGVNTVHITNVPVGAVCSVTVPANQGIVPILDLTINDGYLDITTTVAGAYVVTLKSQTFLDFTVNLNAS